MHTHTRALAYFAQPRGDGEGEFRLNDWVPRSGLSNTAPFAHYAISAASQALEDAKWGEFSQAPLTHEQQCASGVAIGAGMSSTEDLYDAGLGSSMARSSVNTHSHTAHQLSIQERFSTTVVCGV